MGPAVVPSFESVSLLEVAEAREPREPLPVATGEPAAPGDDEPERAVVEGIMCARQHFNSPDALYCSSCGISMVHQTHNLVTGARPPLGFLVFDNGAMFTLDSDYVLGREPEAHGDTKTARPLALDDPERSISRIHADVRLVGWDVQLTDRGSANGTFVWDEGARQWQRIPENTPTAIRPGAQVALGRRTFVYRTPHKR